MNKKNKSSFNTKEVIFLVTIACVLSFSMAILISNYKKKNYSVVEDSNLNEFVEQYNYIVDNYWEDVDKSKLIEGAIEGMVEALDDPHTNYFDETETNNFNTRLDGAYEGVGIEIIKLLDGTVYVINVLENSIAYEKGVKPGDIITFINDKDVTELTNDEFLKLIKENESVSIKVNRENEELEFDLTKSFININSVTSKKINDMVGYIKVDIFATNTTKQFEAKLNELEKDKISGLIIDLRDNSGGHLTVAEDILSMFLNEDKVIYQIEDQDGIKKYYSKGNENKKYKIAILINNNSASASELVSATLREQLGAVLIGEKTYGKGSVQELITLPSGKQYKVTTKKWLTSKGKYINDVGVEPDIELVSDDDSIYIERVLESFKLES